MTYERIKAEYGLGAPMVIRCLANVGDSYKLDRKSQRHYRPHGSVVFDDRILSFNPDNDLLSIWTVHGCQSMPFVAGERQRRLLQRRHGESALVYRKGTFFLLVTCNVDEPTPGGTESTLGVDLGIVNLASDSDENVSSGAQIETTRQWYGKRRSALQSVGTKSAKRRLKKLSGRQRRFETDTNHCIRKGIVGRVKGTGRGRALEELMHIRERGTVGHTQRARHRNWSFGQLRGFLSYKARRVGTPVTLTNMVEGYNRQIRTVTKTKGALPSDDAARKLLFLVTRDITKDWTAPIFNWAKIRNQLAIRGTISVVALRRQGTHSI